MILCSLLVGHHNWDNDKQQLIQALYNEYVFLCHDDFDPDEDATPEEYLEMLKEMSYDQLVEETQTDDIFTIDEFMRAWA